MTEEDLWQQEWESEVWQTAFWFAWYGWANGDECDEFNSWDQIIESAIISTEVEWMPKEKLDAKLAEMGWSEDKFKIMMDITMMDFEKKLDEDFPSN